MIGKQIIVYYFACRYLGFFYCSQYRRVGKKRDRTNIEQTLRKHSRRYVFCLNIVKALFFFDKSLESDSSKSERHIDRLTNLTIKNQ